MKLSATLDLVIGAGLAWSAYALREALASADAWLVVGIGLLAVVMLVSGVALAVGTAWGQRLGRAGAIGGLLLGGVALVAGSVLLIGGDRQDAGSGAAKATLGVAQLLVFGLAFWANRAPSRQPS